MCFHVIYIILAGLLYCAVNFVNPHESCGFEYLIIYQRIFPFFLFASILMLLLCKRLKSLKTIIFYNLFMAFPLSLVFHGICEHTTYSYLIFLVVLQIVYYFPLLITKIYKNNEISNALIFMIFVLFYIGIIIQGSLLMSNYEWLSIK